MFINSFESDYTYVRDCLDEIASVKSEQVPDNVIDQMSLLRLRMEHLTRELTRKEVKELQHSDEDVEAFPFPKNLSHQSTAATRAAYIPLPKKLDQKQIMLAKAITIETPQLIRSQSSRKPEMNRSQSSTRSEMNRSELSVKPELNRSESSSRQPCVIKDQAAHHLPSNVRQLRRAWSDREFERAYGSRGWTRELKSDSSNQGEGTPPATPIQSEFHTKKSVQSEVSSHRQHHNKRERSATMEKDYEYIAPSGKQLFTHRRKSKSLSALVEIDTSSSVKPFPSSPEKEDKKDKDMYSYIKSAKAVGGRPRQASSTRLWESELSASIEYVKEEKTASSERMPRFKNNIFGKKTPRAPSADSRLPGVAV